MSDPQSFRGAVYAIAVALAGRRTVVPTRVRSIARRVGRRVIRALDARRERVEAEAHTW